MNNQITISRLEKFVSGMPVPYTEYLIVVNDCVLEEVSVEDLKELRSLLDVVLDKRKEEHHVQK